MHLLTEGPVLDSEIDALGHMNVRFYLARIDQAGAGLLAALGINAVGCTETVVRRVDTYSRFSREQFADSHLQVLGGVLAVNGDQVQCYFEIRNPAKDQLAASFITVNELIDKSTQQRLVLPQGLMCENSQYLVELPDYSAPRSLTLDAPRTDITLAELESRITAAPAAGMMSGRFECTLEAQDCDANGYLLDGLDLMFVMFRALAVKEGRSFGPPVLQTDEGTRMGWAMIETRAMALGRPRVGDQLVSVGADITFGDRWRQSRRWAFIASSGEMIGINDTVGIALDLDARRSIVIPPSVRKTLEDACLPDLA